MNTLRFILALSLCALFLQVGSAARAQCQPQWLPTSSAGDAARYSFGDGEVLAIEFFDPDAEGPELPRLVVAGSFTKNAAGEKISSVVMWNTYAWKSLGSSFSGPVACLKVHRGELYAGGSFLSVDGKIANGIARWSGTAWLPIVPNTGSGSVDVRSICSYEDELVVFGPALPHGVNAKYVARFDGDTWRPLRQSYLGIVTGIAVHENSLFVSERMAPDGKITFSYGLARWNGTALDPVYVSPTYGANSRQMWLLSSVGGKLSALASYTGADSWGNPRIAYSGIRQTSLPGVVPPTFETAMPFYAEPGVPWMISQVGGRFVVAHSPYVGSYGTTLSSWRTAYARWSVDNNLGLPMVRSILEVGNRTYLGGGFLKNQAIYNTTAPTTDRFAYWESGNWARPGVGISGDASRVTAMCEFENELVLVGAMQMVNGEAGHAIVRWDGFHYREFAQPIDGVVAAAVVHNGELIVAGLFKMPDIDEFVHVAAWNGSRWRSMNAGLEGSGNATAIGFYKGDIVIGGEFRKVTGSDADLIARWDGHAWVPIEDASGRTIDGTPFAFIEFEGRLIVGGQFATAGGKPASRIAAWNGTDWQALGNGLGGTNSVVRALANYNGMLLAGGTFSQSGTVGGIRNLARWTGTAWQQFAGGLNGGIYALVISENDLLVGGTFTNSGNTSLKRLAKWSGTSWSQIASGVDAPVLCILPRANELVIGGEFATLGGTLSAFWGRLVNDQTPIASKPLASSPVFKDQGATLTAWPAFGYAELAGGLSYQWQYNSMPLQNGASQSGAFITGASGVLTSTREVALRIDNIQNSDAGNYSIRYWNSCGEATSVPVAITVKAHAADLNADGMVDDADFSLFITQYNTLLCADPSMPDSCSADFNHDGLVDDADFSIFIPAYDIMVFP